MPQPNNSLLTPLNRVGIQRNNPVPTPRTTHHLLNQSQLPLNLTRLLAKITRSTTHQPRNAQHLLSNPLQIRRHV
jgi:hypothetical protein